MEKQIKTIEDQGKKQVKALEVFKPVEQKLTIKNTIPEDQLKEEAKNKIGKIKKRKNSEQRKSNL